MTEINAENAALPAPPVESAPSAQQTEEHAFAGIQDKRQTHSSISEENLIVDSSFLDEDKYSALFPEVEPSELELPEHEAEEEPKIGDDKPKKSTLESADIKILTHAHYSDVISIRDDFLDETPLYDLTPVTMEAKPSTSSSEASVSIKSEELEEPTVDRHMYYMMHEMYTNKLKMVKNTNSMLQKKMAEYYLRRKMFQYLATEEKHEDKKRYDKMLDELEVKLEVCSREQTQIEEDVELLTRKCATQKAQVLALFQKLITQETEFSKVIAGAADEKTKANIEKFVEQHTSRQKYVLVLLRQMRLVYIKTRNKYNELNKKLEATETLGSHLRLMDYEKLKDDNRNLSEKFEEKDTFLTAIRKQCHHLMQVLAHNREKLASINLAIDEFNGRLESITDDLMEAREQVGALKIERDELRNEIRKIKDKTGLLGRPKLLRDMDSTLKEIQDGKVLLDKYKKYTKRVTKFIEHLRVQHSEDDLRLFVDNYKRRISKRATK